MSTNWTRGTGVMITTWTDGDIIITNSGEQLMTPNVTIPARFVSKGTILRATLWGVASSAATTPGTLTWKIRWSPYPATGLAGTVIFTQIMNQTTAGATDASWFTEYVIYCTDSLLGGGSTNSLGVNGWTMRRNQPAQATGDVVPDVLPVSFTAPVDVGTGLDVQSVISFTASPSLTTASLTCQGLILERI